MSRARRNSTARMADTAMKGVDEPCLLTVATSCVLSTQVWDETSTVGAGVTSVGTTHGMPMADKELYIMAHVCKLTTSKWQLHNLVNTAA